MVEIMEMPERGTLAFEIARHAIADVEGVMTVANFRTMLESIFGVLTRHGTNPRTTPFNDKSMAFEVTLDMPKDSPLMDILRPEAVGPMTANVTVTTGGMTWDFRAQTFPIGERHIECMCERCERYAFAGY